MILDIAPQELLVLGTVALLVIPPKDLPKAMRIAGQWMSRARGMARTFRSGFDDMMRESEFQEMEKKWKEENERIMREFPPTADQAALMEPIETPPVEEMALVAEQPPRKRAVKPRAKPAAKTPAKPKPKAAAKPRAKAKS